jgi:hypothetical protein
MDDIIYIVPDVPFSLPWYLDEPLFSVGYYLYLFLLQITRRHILFSSEAVLLMILAAIVAYIGISTFRDFRSEAEIKKIISAYKKIWL